MYHLISVLVRSHNDAAFIEKTLRAVLNQECAVPFEVICCDDGSTDRTAEIIDSTPGIVRLPRPDGEYRPGQRLNYMIRHSRGDIIVFNNADAVPVDSHWLSELVKPLIEGKADAVYGNQLSRPDAAYLVRKDNLRAFGDGREAARWRFFFSLATAAALRSDLSEHPFDETLRYSEDVEWAHRRPLRICYAMNARVEHSHNYAIQELKRRFYGEGSADAVIFGERPNLIREMISAGMETCRDFRFLLTHPAGLSELPGAPLRRFIQRFFHWKGVRDHVRSSRKTA